MLHFGQVGVVPGEAEAEATGTPPPLNTSVNCPDNATVAATLAVRTKDKKEGPVHQIQLSTHEVTP